MKQGNNNTNKKRVSPPIKSHLYKVVGLAFISILITFFSFKNSLKNEFTNWDDPGYVLDNALVKSLDYENIRKIFSSNVMGNYHPIAILSLAVDYNFYQQESYGYHKTSLILHLLNVLLVFIFIYLLTKKEYVAFLTALIFGIHPMHVESVAWVAERKDLLYLLFYVLALITYTLYVKNNKGKKYYILTIVCFVLSLLSKAQAVTFPIILLLIDYFVDRKFDKSVFTEKIPFFLLSLTVGIIAVYAQKESGAIRDIPQHSFIDRIWFASYSFLSYIVKLIIPYKLSAYYPYPIKNNNLYPIVYYASVIISALIAFFTFKAYKNQKTLFFGGIFFIVNIFLLLQLLPVGGSMMSERYTYLSYIGLSFIVAHILVEIIMPKSNYLAIGISALYLCILCYKTIERNKIWNNSELLWTDVISKYPEVVIAYNNRGSYYQKKEKLDEALKDFNKAIELKHDYPEALINRSDVYRVKGQNDLAITDCNKAIEADKNYSGAYMNRGIAYCIVGKFDDAFKDFKTVIEKDPKNSSVYCNRGNLYDMRNQLDSAIADYSLAISLNNNYPDAYYNRAKTYMRKKNYQQSLSDFAMAIQLKTKNPDVYFYRSQLFIEVGDYLQAYNDLLSAKQMGKAIEDAYLNQVKSLIKK